MGRAKEWLLEQEERGWWSVPNKYVCTECFDDECLKQVIRDNLKAPKCDYCGSTSEELIGEENELIAAPVDAVIEAIAEGRRSEWNTADDEGIPYESAEGGYQANTLDSYDFVWDYVCPNNEALAEDLIEALGDQVWVERNYWSLSQDQELWYGWENFCQMVKHQNRYMFHLIGRKPSSAPTAILDQTIKFTNPVAQAESADSVSVTPASDQIAVETELPSQSAPDNSDMSDFQDAMLEAQEGVSASRMLAAIGEAIEEGGLIRTLPQSTKLFRGRVGPAGRPYRSSGNLGPPPPSKAIASRMSPAGIPMFYGALDEHTAIAETVLGNLKKGKIINMGAFITREEFLVVDLTALMPIPSLFSERRYLRPTLTFLHSFVRDLSKPIKKDGREHVEYVPTQIVTEYFRHAHQSQGGLPVRGILYPSSRARAGTACVLFFTKDECAPQRKDSGKSRKQWLDFVRGSAKSFKRKPRRQKTLADFGLPRGSPSPAKIEG